MARLSPKLRSIRGGIMHWCPGCQCAHLIFTSEGPDWPPAESALTHPEGTRKHGSTGQEWVVQNRQWVRLKWQYNGSIEKPTTKPSVRIFVTDDEDETGRPLPAPIERTLCHYFLTDGNLVFCGDSKHILAGQTVPLPDIPENYGGGE
jgi:hypothetical protein